MNDRQRSRCERALEQRRSELTRWEGEPDKHPRVSCTTSNQDLRVNWKEKAAIALDDIHNLERKLGIYRKVEL